MEVLYKYANESFAFRFFYECNGVLSIHYFEYPQGKLLGDELVQAQIYIHALVKEKSEMNELRRVYLNRNKKETTKKKRKMKLMNNGMTYKIVSITLILVW